MAIYRGVVEKGKSRGKALGYPTANIHAEGIDGGIYAARVWFDGRQHSAAVFVDPSRHLLEAHILDFSEDVYGKELKVELLRRVRPTKQFYSDAELRRAIAADVESVREILKTI